MSMKKACGALAPQAFFILPYYFSHVDSPSDRD